MANRLWGQEGMTFEEPFLDAMVEHFGAPLVADFAEDPDAAREEINRWVGETTAGPHPELFPDGTIDDSTRLALVNAMHLDAPWEFDVRPGGDRRRRVHPGHGTTVQVPMMHYSEYLPTGFGDDWQAVSCPTRAAGCRWSSSCPRTSPTSRPGWTATSSTRWPTGSGRRHPPHDAQLLVLDPRLARRAAAGDGCDLRLR